MILFCKSYRGSTVIAPSLQYLQVPTNGSIEIEASEPKDSTLSHVTLNTSDGFSMQLGLHETRFESL